MILKIFKIFNHNNSLIGIPMNLPDVVTPSSMNQPQSVDSNVCC